MRILHWFRKDHRLDDNTALAAAAAEAKGDVVPVYVSEPSVLRDPRMGGARLRFALDSLRSLASDIGRAGGRLVVRSGEAAEVIPALARELRADAVHWNAEHEPALAARDRAVAAALEAAGVRARVFDDRLLVAPGAVATKAGKPYTVYTPFRKACEELAIGEPLPRVARLRNVAGVRSVDWADPIGLCRTLGLDPGPEEIPAAGARASHGRLEAFCEAALADYATGRDLLDLDGTSRLAADLRFGTISVRTVVARVREATRGNARAAASAAKFVEELRWRDFYTHVLHHFPHVERRAFRPEMDAVAWDDDPERLALWTQGRTGYPVVDAAMRALRATGWMHNRARMVVASFLTKDLGIDWRLGELHFLRELVDGDLANNNGGWQWAASTGTDATPWFRIFNPVLQGRRFDRSGRFVARWVPELAKLSPASRHAPWEVSPLELSEAGVVLGETYPRPCVDHAKARKRTLARFEAAAKKSPKRRR